MRSLGRLVSGAGFPIMSAVHYAVTLLARFGLVLMAGGV